MNVIDKISHAAERKAFETILDSMLKKGQTQDVGELADSLIFRFTDDSQQVRFDLVGVLGAVVSGHTRLRRNPARAASPAPCPSG